MEKVKDLIIPKKLCPTCGKVEEFGFNKARADGLQQECKKCRNQKKKARRGECGVKLIIIDGDAPNEKQRREAQVFEHLNCKVFFTDGEVVWRKGVAGFEPLDMWIEKVGKYEQVEV